MARALLTIGVLAATVCVFVDVDPAGTWQPTVTRDSILVLATARRLRRATAIFVHLTHGRSAPRAAIDEPLAAASDRSDTFWHVLTLLAQ